MVSRKNEGKTPPIEVILMEPVQCLVLWNILVCNASLLRSIIKGLDKASDRFQQLYQPSRVYGAAVPNEDANQKFLRALPLSWNNVALIMRNKYGRDDLDIDDL
ncbi:hypothetical protein Tco_0516669 [Tanacetum coccineum]